MRQAWDLHAFPTLSERGRNTLRFFDLALWGFFAALAVIAAVFAYLYWLRAGWPAAEPLLLAIGAGVAFGLGLRPLIFYEASEKKRLEVDDVGLHLTLANGQVRHWRWASRTLRLDLVDRREMLATKGLLAGHGIEFRSYWGRQAFIPQAAFLVILKEARSRGLGVGAPPGRAFQIVGLAPGVVWYRIGPRET